MIQVASRLPEPVELLEFDNASMRRVWVAVPEAEPLEFVSSGRFRTPVQDDHHLLKLRLGTQLRERLQIPEGGGRQQSREDAIMTARDRSGALNAVQREWREFLASLVRLDVTIGGVQLKNVDELISAEREKLVRRIFELPGMQGFPIASPLTTDLLTQDGQTIEQTANRKLLELIPSVVDQMIVNLDTLVNESVCGIIVRFPNQTCEYYYAYTLRNIEYRGLSSSIDFVSEQSELPKLAGPQSWVPVSVRADRSVLESRCFRRHQLIHTVESAPQYGLIEVPQFHKQVIAAVPSWLASEVKLVEGTLVGITTIDQLCDSLEDTQLLHGFSQVSYQFDPALVLGQYVLTGWGPHEIEAERDKVAPPALDVNPSLPRRFVDWLHQKVFQFFQA